MTFYRPFYKLTCLLLICNLLIACTQSHRNLTIIDKLQNSYQNAVSLDNQYKKGLYGQPDPASYERLKRYKYESYEALMQFRSQFDKTKPIPQGTLSIAQLKIDNYVSYLNALGATSATKNTLTGF